MSSTNTHMSPPECENCGRSKSATYLCNVCINKLNAMHNDLAKENAELRILREDLFAASGELLIPCPIPGSIESKMLIANRLLKSKLAAADNMLDALRSEVREYDDSWDEWQFRDLSRLAGTVHRILYPKGGGTC